MNTTTMIKIFTDAVGGTWEYTGEMDRIMGYREEIGTGAMMAGTVDGQQLQGAIWMNFETMTLTVETHNPITCEVVEILSEDLSNK